MSAAVMDVGVAAKKSACYTPDHKRKKTLSDLDILVLSLVNFVL